MDELFHQLETRIKTLAQRCVQLESANHLLRQRQIQLQQERETLQAKNKIAIAQIENMVSRLKTIEQPT